MSILGSPLLAAQPWLEHGFGTRDDHAWTPPGDTAKLKQTHSDRVVTADCAGEWGEGDALASQTPGLWLAIRTADCVPILLADPVQRVVAAVHAGWKGTAAEIARRTVEQLWRDFGTEPRNLIAAIGPAIGVCCFEVGPELAELFPLDRVEKSPRPHVNLLTANTRQLLNAGLQPHNIDALQRCTVCEPVLFHSFRRDRGDGRMISSIRRTL